MVELFYSLSGRVRVSVDSDGLFRAERIIAPETWAIISFRPCGSFRFYVFEQCVDEALSCDHSAGPRRCSGHAWRTLPYTYGLCEQCGEERA